MSLEDAAETYDVSTRTIRRYISAGLIEGIRVGPRLVRVDLNELDARMCHSIPSAAS